MNRRLRINRGKEGDTGATVPALVSPLPEPSAPSSGESTRGAWTLINAGAMAHIELPSGNALAILIDREDAKRIVDQHNRVVENLLNEIEGLNSALRAATASPSISFSPSGPGRAVSIEVFIDTTMVEHRMLGGMVAQQVVTSRDVTATVRADGNVSAALRDAADRIERGDNMVTFHSNTSHS